MLEYLVCIDKTLFEFINIQLANPVTDLVMPWLTSDTFLRLTYGIIMVLLLWRGDARWRWLVLFSALVLPSQSESAEMAAGGAGSPDTSFTYTAQDLYRMAEAYGEQGRKAYVEARFTFDLIWPVVYTLFLVTATSWVYSRAFAPGSLWQLANLVPVLGALFDYLENVSTSLVMARFPAPVPVVAAMAPVFTLVKWVLLGLSFVLLVIGIVAAIWRWARLRSRD